MNIISNLDERYNFLSLENSDVLFEYNGRIYKTVINALVDCCLPNGLEGMLGDSSTETIVTLFPDELLSQSDRVEDILFNKFNQNKSLANRLLETGDTIIAIDYIGNHLMEVRKRLSMEGVL